MKDRLVQIGLILIFIVIAIFLMIGYRKCSVKDRMVRDYIMPIIEGTAFADTVTIPYKNFRSNQIASPVNNMINLNNTTIETAFTVLDDNNMETGANIQGTKLQWGSIPVVMTQSNDTYAGKLRMWYNQITLNTLADSQTVDTHALGKTPTGIFVMIFSENSADSDLRWYVNYNNDTGGNFWSDTRATFRVGHSSNNSADTVIRSKARAWYW